MSSENSFKTANPPGPSAQERLAAAVRLLQTGRFAEARSAYQAILAENPRNVLAMHHLGIVEAQCGNAPEGLRLLKQCTEQKPDYAQAHCDLGVILMQFGRDEEAIEACRQATVLSPGLAAAHSNLGDLMQRRGDAKAAEAAYGQAVKLQPGLAGAHASRADALITLGRLEEARQSCEAALRLSPQLALGFGVMGLLLYRERKHEEALLAYEKALWLDPNLAIVHTRYANLLREMGRYEEALQANGRALTADPTCLTALCNHALILQALGRYRDAVAACSRALEIRPDFPDALANLGMLLHQLGNTDQGIEALQRAAKLAPEEGHIYVNLGNLLKTKGDHAEAMAVYQAMLRACGENAPPQGLYDLCNLRRLICDWDGLDEAERQAIDALKRSGERMPPFAALSMSCKPQDHLDIARLWASGYRSTKKLAPDRPRTTSGRRIRLGYLSADFYQHATAFLLAELIERHDRDRFEVFAYCFSSDDNSLMRQRLVTGFDWFRIVEALSHEEAAGLIAGDGIDILLDLKGYTRNARSMIVAQRPAPIQVNYLGYPSTMGAPFIDYIIADPVIAPMEHQRFIDEKIVHLPGCYQPNDAQRLISEQPSTRADHGLPDNGFVFCSFNNSYKIAAPFFSIWMRLLDRVPGSVLWLLEGGEAAKENLRREAVARGVDPARLVFASRLPAPEHLARYQHADLVLDNLPVNAHTTASDALWGGVPIITCLGNIFVGRVCASLLQACGLPELITNSLEEYEALALRLASNRAELDRLKLKLNSVRQSAPLFDTATYACNLEAAFSHMMRLHSEGRSPEAFAVAEISAR